MCVCGIGALEVGGAAVKGERSDLENSLFIMPLLGTFEGVGRRTVFARSDSLFQQLMALSSEAEVYGQSTRGK